MGSISRWIPLSIKKLPRERKTKLLYGEKDDTGKFFKCWNCGFIVDSKKHPVTDRAYVSFTTFPEWVNLTEMDSATDYQDEIVCEDNTTTILVGKDLYYSDTSVGCPFCNSPNYK